MTLKKMTFRNLTILKSTLLLTALAAFATLTGCSSSSPQPLTVTLSTVSSPLTVNSQTPITATVANDSASGGVTWSCTPASTCGTFNPTTTASGVATTYTAPATVGSVTITATSVTTSTISASTSSISIAGATLADGTYVFSLTGEDSNFLYSVSGAFKLAGGAFSVAVSRTSSTMGRHLLLTKSTRSAAA